MARWMSRVSLRSGKGISTGLSVGVVLDLVPVGVRQPAELRPDLLSQVLEAALDRWELFQSRMP
jgi:hypothetical protein